jgi:uncharacterized membrane protein
MSIEGIFQVALILAVFLCSLATGLLFTFAIVVMPGIRALNDREFIQAFQVIDGVIQNNQPVFMLVWVGSVLFLGLAAVLGVVHLDGIDRLLVIIAGLVYLLGVQLPTARINIPLNNELQSLKVDKMNETEQSEARKNFEPRWNRWNGIRAVFASLATGLLIILALRL